MSLFLLNYHPLNRPTILWRLFVLSIVQDLEVEAEQVDGDGVFPGVVLLAAGEEGLREEESRHPEHGGSALFIPVLRTQQRREETHRYNQNQPGHRGAF